MVRKAYFIFALGSLLAMLAPTLAHAVPAAPITHNLKQADGSTIKARLHGDEWYHWWTTLDNQRIEYNAATRMWMPAPPRAAPMSAIERHNRGFSRVVPATGTANVPVLMINFSNTTTTYQPSDFNNMLFGSTGKTMRNFYTENSYGQFTVSAGPSGVGGWYTAAKTHDSYGDAHVAELVIEAVKAADDAGYNFAACDQNGDGYVDVVNVVHQGNGQDASGDPTDIWSQSWDLNSAAAYGDGTGAYTTHDGVTVNAFVCQPETLVGGMATVGVYCHEYGHALGLPDFYDYTYTSSGLGNWTLMAGGSWGGNNGDTPTHFDAWCVTHLGWVTPTIVTASVPSALIPQIETNPVIYKLWATGGPGNEYFLVENRQRVSFDTSLPGAGLLIYHVDDAVTDNDHTWYPPDYMDSGHYHVALEQADDNYDLEKFAFESGDAADPYPGSTDNRTFNDTSSPNSRPYSGAVATTMVTNVSNSGTTMTADLGFVDNPPGPAKSVMAYDTPKDEGGSITVSWGKSVDDGRGANDVAGYRVYRASDPAGPFASISGDLPAGSTTYADAPVPNLTPFYYKVSVFDAHSEVFAPTSGSVGPVMAKDDLPPDQITTLIASDTPGDDGGAITLSWAGYPVLPPSEFTEYRIYRGTASFSDVTGLTPLATINDPTVQTYIDNTTEDGTAYWYAVTAVDEAPWFNENKLVIAAGPAYSYPNFSFSFPSGLSMISIGADTLEKDMAVLMGVAPTDLSLARWNPTSAAYQVYHDNPADLYLQQALGRAFWVRLTAPVIGSYTGYPAGGTAFDVPILPGWNMIGNPFTTPFMMSTVSVVLGGTEYPLATSNLNRWTVDYGWAYDGAARSYILVSQGMPFGTIQLGAGRGMFFFSNISGALRIQKPASAAQVAVPQAPKPSDNNWALRLIARAGTAADTDNFIGVAPAAAEYNSIISPPLVEPGVDLYFGAADGAHQAGSFVSSLAQGHAWDINVACDLAGTPVELSWPDLSALPKNVRPVLTDLDSGKSVYLRTSASYSYTPAQPGIRRFRLTVAGDGVGSLAVSAMSAMPTVGGAQLTYTLSTDARVSVEVLNLAGRSIRTIVSDRVSPAGSNVVLWDGRNDGGVAAPAGSYMVRLTAVAENGQTVSALRRINVTR